MTDIESIAARGIAKTGSFVGIAARAGALTLALLPTLAASAAPVELKLAFFTSEKSDTYRHGVQPFVDAVNAEGKGLVTIKVYPDGALGKALAEQPNMVLEEAADIAWVVPGQTPYRFPDNQALELPGLFRDVREGTLVYTRLLAASALRGYQDFVVHRRLHQRPQHHPQPQADHIACRAQRAENPRQQCDGGGGARTPRRHSDRHAGLTPRRRAGARCRRWRHHEPDRLVPVRRRANGDQPLPSRHRRRAAGGAYEPQEVRRLAGSGADAHPQIQRRARGDGLDRVLRRQRARLTREDQIRPRAQGGRAVASRPRGRPQDLSNHDRRLGGQERRTIANS